MTFLVVTLLELSSCAPAANGDCLGPADCVEASASMCPACPLSYDQICAQGSCLPVSDSKLAVRADVALHFSLTGHVASVTYAFVDPRAAGSSQEIDCEQIGSGRQELTPAHNVVGAGFVNFQATSGTAMFPDANFGTQPSGAFILVVRGFSDARGDGDLTAVACLDDVQISGSDPVKLTVSLRPVD